MPPTKTPFKITAPPSTDIWRKPPKTNIFNAPNNMAPPIPLPRFLSSKITFSIPCKYRYDQGGLLLHLSKSGEEDRWLKTGVEFYNGRGWISTVGCDGFADWSVFPVGGEVGGGGVGGVGGGVGGDGVGGDGEVMESEYTVEARREEDENGKSLWVYWVRRGERVPIREVAWFFAGEEEGWHVAVGAMACRPAASEIVSGESLEVRFWDFEVKLRE